MSNENEMIYRYYIHYDATTSYVRKDWKYQRGNQKSTIDERQAIQWLKKDKQWSSRNPPCALNLISTFVLLVCLDW
jgi:hypothetical protein